MIPISSLIFDFDGTLVDSAPDIANAVNYTLINLKLPTYSKNEIQNFVGDGVRTLLERAIGKTEDAFIQQALTIFKPYYLEHCVEQTILYPNVKQTLEFFKDKSLALVTNKPYDMVLKTLEHFSLTHYFQLVLGGDSTQNRKPHPEPILKTMETFQCLPQQTLMVGDGITDICAAQSAGAKTCAVTYGYRTQVELEKLKPDFCINKIEDLKKIVM